MLVMEKLKLEEVEAKETVRQWLVRFTMLLKTTL